MRLRLAIYAVLVLLLPGKAFAHPPVPTVALVKVEMDGRVRTIVIHDALAYALNDTSARIGDPEMYALLNGPTADIADALQDGKERMESGFHLLAGGKRITGEIVRSPGTEDIVRWKTDNPGLGLPVKLEFEFAAVIPESTPEITFRFPVVLDTVLLVVDRPGVEPAVIPLSPGETSPVIEVRVVTGVADPSAPPQPSDPLTAWQTAWRYAALGYRHVVPDGTDHAVFVFGLFLLSPRVKSVVWQITAFTVAHSITLTLASLQLVSVSSHIVEPTIAITIAFIAVENLFVRRVHPWRPMVAFVFGLIHGLGFASALSEVGLPTGQLVAGLIAFNVGVEGGHLTVLLLAFLMLVWCRGKTWYRARVVLPVSLLIAVVASYWALQRLAGAA